LRCLFMAPSMVFSPTDHGACLVHPFFVPFYLPQPLETFRTPTLLGFALFRTPPPPYEGDYPCVRVPLYPGSAALDSPFRSYWLGPLFLYHYCLRYLLFPCFPFEFAVEDRTVSSFTPPYPADTLHQHPDIATTFELVRWQAMFLFSPEFYPPYAVGESRLLSHQPVSPPVPLFEMFTSFPIHLQRVDFGSLSGRLFLFPGHACPPGPLIHQPTSLRSPFPRTCVAGCLGHLRAARPFISFIVPPYHIME